MASKTTKSKPGVPNTGSRTRGAGSPTKADRERATADEHARHIAEVAEMLRDGATHADIAEHCQRPKRDGGYGVGDRQARNIIREAYRQPAKLISDEERDLIKGMSVTVLLNQVARLQSKPQLSAQEVGQLRELLKTLLNVLGVDEGEKVNVNGTISATAEGRKKSMAILAALAARKKAAGAAELAPVDDGDDD